MEGAVGRAPGAGLTDETSAPVLVSQQLSFFDCCEHSVAPVARALVRAASTLVSTLGVISHWLRLRRSVLHAFDFFSSREDFRSVCPNHQCLVSSLRIFITLAAMRVICVLRVLCFLRAPPREGASAASFSLSVWAFVLCLSPRLRGEVFSSVVWLRLRRFVRQPILAAAGFQPALAGCKGSLSARISRLKGGCGQNCPPHDLCRILKWPNGDGRMGTAEWGHP